MIGALEDAEDYEAFEAAITADYDAESAVERELVLRLASILWRLRRATIMETGLFEIHAQRLRDFQENCQVPAHSNDAIQALFRPDDSTGGYGISHSALSKIETHPALKADNPAGEFARCFLRLANLPNFALDRLSRYEAILWRHAGRMVYALDKLNRRKPQERARRVWFGAEE